MKITQAILDDLTEQAKASPRLRMNYNFHQSLEDKCHRMVNAVESGTEVPIHRHPTKDESFVILRGKVRVTTHNDDGSIIEDVVLTQESGNYGVDIPKNVWHKKHGNKCPVMLSSSIQATLAGRFGTSEYGKSKKAGEELFFDYSKETGAKVLVYRFPNLFGKWCRPNYNSAVATFCNAFANDLPYTVNDPSVELELLYIDDLVDEMICALLGKEHHCEFDGVETVMKEDGRYCAAPITHKVTLGEIVELLKSFAEQPRTLMIPEIPAGSFAKKLYSTYLSYLPASKVAFPLKMNVDDRGSFTELVHTLNAGQVSINISKPGITKGQHWHNTKFEQFIVVAGHGLIQQRNLNDPEGKVLEWEVSGDNITAVHMLPGYTHNIINLSETEDLVTVMYCNEIFNPNKPDTFFEVV